MKKIALLLLYLFFYFSWVGAQSAAVKAFMADPSLRPASVGIYVANVATGEVVAAVNERQAHIPASTMKTITTGTALRLLGASFTPTTRVEYIGVVDSAGTLQGDLVVRGGGDPSLGSVYGSRVATGFVDAVARELQARGIRHIAGSIQVDNSFFESPAVSPKAMVEDLIWDYGTGCHALSYRDNRVVIKVQFVEGKYKVTDVSPKGLWEVDVDVQKGEKENITVKQEGNCYIVRGTIPRKRDRYTLAFANHRPDELLVRELTTRLQQAGITVANGTVGRLATNSTLLLSYKGDNLGYLIESLNRRSDNLYAESVLRLLSTESHPRGNVEVGLERIRHYWQGCGVDSLELFQYDGSGLARNNKVSARYIGRVLSLMAKDSLVGETFVHSLPVAGKEGTVASFMRGHKLAGELCLKSGSMSDVQGYAGYYTTAHNRYVVVVLVNNYTCKRKQLRQKITTLLTEILSKKV